MQNVSRLSLLAWILALGIGCAAHGPRAKAQVGALALTDLAVDISRAEQTVYEANIDGYTKASHDIVGRGILKVLYATRAYERAAAQWPADGSIPATVSGTAAALKASIDDLVKVVPLIANVREPLMHAIAALQAALASYAPQARLDLRNVPVQQSQIPGGGVMSIFAMLAVAARLMDQGKLTYASLRAFLKKEGATEEDFAEADQLISDEIDRREREHR